MFSFSIKELCRNLCILDLGISFIYMRKQRRYSTIRYYLILLLSYVMLSSCKFLSLLNAFTFIVTKLNWWFIINKPIAYIWKFYGWNSFDFRNILILIKDTCAVCIHVCMAIWKNLPNIIYVLPNQQIPQFSELRSLCSLLPNYSVFWNERSPICEIRLKPFLCFIQNTMHSIFSIKRYDLKYQNSFEDQLKSNLYVFPFQYCLRSCQLFENCL